MDNLITTKLDAVNKLLVHLASEALAVRGLGKEGDDRRTGVATNNSDRDFLGVSASDASEEALGTDDVESSDTENVGRIVYTSLLKDGGDDGTVELTGLEMTRT